MDQEAAPPGGPPSRRRWLPWLAFGAAVVVFFALLPVLLNATSGSGGSSSGLPAKAADFLGYDVYDLPDGQSGVVRFAPAAASLTGPHFSVAFRGVEITDTVGDYGYQAADGYEFLRLAAVVPSLSDSPSDSVSSQVVVDGRAMPVDLVRTEQAGLVVSVPKGHTAILRVTDEGRAQTLDLRSGKRVEAIAGYYPQRTLSWRNGDYSELGKTTVDGCRRQTNLILSLGPDGTAALPWGPEVGWAQPGRAWLPVAYDRLMTPVTLPDYSSFKDWPYSCAEDLGLEWNVAASFSLQTPDGTVAPVRVVSTSSGGTIVFEIPDSVTTATLLVHPVVSSGSRTIDWSQAPPTGQIALTAS